MRDGVIDAMECSRRCLQALADAHDFETTQSLWRAAARYAALAREKRAGASGMLAPAPALGLEGEWSAPCGLV